MPRKPPEYNRKEKSLKSLCLSFITNFGIGGAHPILLDHAAKVLNTERRRMYDIIHVLEALELVVRKGKNQYLWCGSSRINKCVELLRINAIESERRDLFFQISASASSMDSDDSQESDNHDSINSSSTNKTKPKPKTKTKTKTKTKPKTSKTKSTTKSPSPSPNSKLSEPKNKITIEKSTQTLNSTNSPNLNKQDDTKTSLSAVDDKTSRASSGEIQIKLENEPKEAQNQPDSDISTKSDNLTLGNISNLPKSPLTIADIKASMKQENPRIWGLTFCQDIASGMAAEGSGASGGSKRKREKTLSILTQRFVELFLINEKNVLALDKAAQLLVRRSAQDKYIQSLIDNSKSDSDIVSLKKPRIEQREKRTKAKVRRLYDIANILIAVDLIVKVTIPGTRRPAFLWKPSPDGILFKLANMKEGDPELTQLKIRLGVDTEDDDSTGVESEDSIGSDSNTFEHSSDTNTRRHSNSSKTRNSSTNNTTDDSKNNSRLSNRSTKTKRSGTTTRRETPSQLPFEEEEDSSSENSQSHSLRKSKSNANSINPKSMRSRSKSASSSISPSNLTSTGSGTSTLATNGRSGNRKTKRQRALESKALGSSTTTPTPITSSIPTLRRKRTRKSSKKPIRQYNDQVSHFSLLSQPKKASSTSVTNCLQNTLTPQPQTIQQPPPIVNSFDIFFSHPPGMVLPPSPTPSSINNARSIPISPPNVSVANSLSQLNHSFASLLQNGQTPLSTTASASASASDSVPTSAFSSYQQPQLFHPNPYGHSLDIIQNGNGNRVQTTHTIPAANSVSDTATSGNGFQRYPTNSTNYSQPTKRTKRNSSQIDSKVSEDISDSSPSVIPQDINEWKIKAKKAVDAQNFEPKKRRWAEDYIQSVCNWYVLYHQSNVNNNNNNGGAASLQNVPPNAKESSR